MLNLASLQKRIEQLEQRARDAPENITKMIVELAPGEVEVWTIKPGTYSIFEKVEMETIKNE